ncbi:MAG TPA: flagellar basal body P-ring formation chaperone FlgA [Phycisphaerae bacterium]|jgi:flagella basal body P-ring formation protein FlgA|nr:flagellar basal body P-ring formation chaperone FlgA [Phycisphaerae bacterium]
MTLLKQILVSLAAAGMLAGSTLGEVIRLQSKVAVGERQDVRLGDIATISGGTPQQNEELAGMIIISGIQRTQKVKAESVLMAVMAQRNGAMAGLQISGAAECELTFGTPAPVTPKPAPAPAATPVQPAVSTSAPAVAPASQPAAAQPVTLRDTILATLKKAIDLPEEDYQVTINSTSKELDKPLENGRQWLCRPLTNSLIGTVQVESQLMEGTKHIQQMNVTTVVLRRQMVAVLTRKFGRGEIVTADGVRTEAVMMDRKVLTYFGSMTDVVGLEAQRDVEAGERADQHYFKAPLMAHRGDVVTIVFVSGTLVMTTRGRAEEDAKLHDRIQIRNDSNGEKYSAVLVARGLGVTGGTLTDEQEKVLVQAYR